MKKHQHVRYDDEWDEIEVTEWDINEYEHGGSNTVLLLVIGLLLVIAYFMK